MEKTYEYESVRCTFVYEVMSSPDGWQMVEYRNKETDKLFMACGTHLPIQKKVVYDLYGQWTFNKRKQRQFSVSYYDTPKQTDRESVISYLQALKCGFGVKKATAVYDEFGEKTWDIVDENPWELMSVKGVTSGVIDKMLAKRTEVIQTKNLIVLCNNAGVSIQPTTMQSVIAKYGNDASRRITENPYCLLDFEVSFDKADAIASSLGFSEDFPPRLEAGLLTVLKSAEVRGHVCLPREDKTDKEGKVIAKSVVTGMKEYLRVPEDKCKTAINNAWTAGKIRTANGFVFLQENYEQEESIATNLRRLMSASFMAVDNVDNIITECEKANFKLADSQRDAVKMVFQNQMNIITGGPGTGKTTVTKAVLYTHKAVYGESSDPLLLAPTGKASRRMSEATGMPSQTIHSAVGYKGDHVPPDEGMLPGNLIIVDEVSMMDQRIASILLEKIETGAKVVFVGDVDQLPSVGAGNVLMDMINSKVIPVTRLTVIFRQAGDNPIITNAFKINTGDTNLLLNNEFKFIEAKDDSETFEKAWRFYFWCVKAYGIDNVVLLNPQKRNTDVSVPAFNKRLQEELHKPENLQYLGLDTECEFGIRIGDITYRTGDRVMQLKNTERARNRDIGISGDIKRRPDPDDPEHWIYFTYIEFNEDGKLLEYTVNDMRDIDLAYCMTVHKSQGSEYKVVIEVVSTSHPTMLTRKIVYTGITRARQYICLVGQKEALDIAINTSVVEPRHTLLRQRLSSGSCQKNIDKKLTENDKKLTETRQSQQQPGSVTSEAADIMRKYNLKY